MKSRNEIDALVSLLDDPDEIIFNQIKSQLLELGTDCIAHLEKANFELNNKNSNFFVKLLNNNFLNANLKIKNSNIFFRNLENEVMFINKIKNLKYYYHPKKLKNILYSENEIFNTPFSLEVINYEEEKKIYTKLDFDFAKLQIENIFNYEKDIKSG